VDLNTIEAVVRTADPAQWREGDAWLAGGTVLFSAGSPASGQEPLRRLLDLGSTDWTPLAVSAAGIELAATCTIAHLYAFFNLDAASDAGRGLAADWPGVELIRPCCESFVASFKVWTMSTVGGNLCTSLPAGPMISLCAALDGTATILGTGGARRTLPVLDFVTGDGTNALAPGELLRSVSLPASALSSRVAFRRLSLSNLGRSAVLLIGRLDAGGALVLTVTAATKRPVQLRLEASAAALAGALTDTLSDSLFEALDAAIPDELYHDDVHGLAAWRKDMTYRLAQEIRAELTAPAGRDPLRVSGDFWPPRARPLRPESPNVESPSAGSRTEGA
jgi:xanthine dehydrogenase iron-sulfur cluster and FAD-binding subunit A